ncbi:MAG: hypothetical protein AUJ98_06110 [Bacteroidetes bacterium CG2_30_33_31]|nr:MAG: hypothetical protein AUJ98_06110 [Bacteroidetes bacterium CG2_30_33_31]
MIKSISNIFLAFVFLVTTSGLTINTHFCMGEIYSVAFFKDAKSCCEDVNHHHNFCKAGSKNHHCQNKSLNIKVTNDFSEAFTDMTLPNVQFVQLFVSSFIHYLNDLPKKSANNSFICNNISPPRAKNLNALFQSFLI